MMPESPEESTTGLDQPFRGSVPEGLIEDKEKAVDIAYASKETRDVARRMEKLNPVVAAELHAEADQLEQSAEKKYDKETEYVNEQARHIAKMVIFAESSTNGSASMALAEDISYTALERIRHQFFGLFEGGIEARKKAKPEKAYIGYWSEFYIVETSQLILSESVRMRNEDDTGYAPVCFQIHTKGSSSLEPPKYNELGLRI